MSEETGRASRSTAGSEPGVTGGILGSLIMGWCQGENDPCTGVSKADD